MNKKIMLILCLFLFIGESIQAMDLNLPQPPAQPIPNLLDNNKNTPPATPPTATPQAQFNGISFISDHYKWILPAASVLFVSAKYAIEALKKRKILRTTTFVGLLRIEGSIMKADKYVAQIRALAVNPHIKGILVEINSGGGSAAASEVIFNELKKCAEQKPVVAVVTGIACSGAYLIGTAAPIIIAPAMSSVGNIGTFIEMFHFTESPRYYMFDADNLSLTTGTIEFEELAAGDFKRAGSIARPLKPEERALFEQNLKDVYDYFCSVISVQRHISIETHNEWAQGRIFVGSQALKLKLIDKIGSTSDAIAELISLMKQKYGEENIFASNVALVDPGSKSFLERFVASFATALSQSVTPQLKYNSLNGL